MKIYISGKITGDRRYKAKFREAEKTLADGGPIVLTPVDEKEDFAYMVLPVRIKNG